ncbi:peptide deformylase [Aquitalea sp. S1-19]|nr:peptide deformylase [Aquitalea sp. S1-19]
MPADTPIIQLGHPVLRQVAQPVADIHASAVQALIDTLIASVKEANGVGIAAPQIASSLRLFVVASRPSVRYPYAPDMAPTAMINPCVLCYGSEKVKDWEGCLSVGGLRALVPRHQSIEVEYTDRHGQCCRQVLDGFVARIFQHELDHLDGLVFLDRVEHQDDVFSEEEYQQYVAARTTA